MSTPSETRAVYESLGTQVILYANRLEHKLPGCLFRRTETIFYRNIASIERPPLLAALDIHTSDGKVHRIALNPPAKAEELKNTLEALL